MRELLLLEIRPATAGDSEAVAAIYLDARKAFLPYAPPAHTDAEVREWVAQKLIPSGGVTVAVDATGVLGMIAVSRGLECGWIHHLYVRPASVGRMVGSQLLRGAMQQLTPPVRLYTFQANAGARRFYERHGFVPIAFSDGSGNEERCPDVLYEFNPASGPDNPVTG